MIRQQKAPFKASSQSSARGLLLWWRPIARAISTEAFHQTLRQADNLLAAVPWLASWQAAGRRSGKPESCGSEYNYRVPMIACKRESSGMARGEVPFALSDAAVFRRTVNKRSLGALTRRRRNGKFAHKHAWSGGARRCWWWSESTALALGVLCVEARSLDHLAFFRPHKSINTSPTGTRKSVGVSAALFCVPISTTQISNTLDTHTESFSRWLDGETA